MNSINAYEIIALHALAEAGCSDWDALVSEIVINRRLVSISCYFELANLSHPTPLKAPFPLFTRATHAALFLGDEWCAATGEIIWGFTFRYFNNDNFTIDYRYERPDWVCPLTEGETIQGDLLAQSIQSVDGGQWAR